MCYSCRSTSGPPWSIDFLWSSQWLLGKGIESIQELIERGDNQSTSPPETSSKGYLEGSETPPQFPLDPDLGRYCELVASKPRVRNSISAREACALAAIATTRSAAAMKRTGLAVSVLNLYLNVSRLMVIILPFAQDPPIVTPYPCSAQHV